MANRKTTIFLFNLSLDLDNPILATTNLWVNEFASHFDFVHVYSTHIGRYEIPANVNVTELGGGTPLKRIVALVKLTTLIPRVLLERRNSVVFHHQSPRTAVFPGLIFRFFGVMQGLWYSHSKKPFSLVLGSLIVNKLYSSSRKSLPLSSTKGNFLGHGIDSLEAIKYFNVNVNRENQILFVGRLAPIKRLEECILALGEVEEPKPAFVAIGPSEKSEQYLRFLDSLSGELEVKFEREFPISHNQVFDRMARSEMYFAGMRNSVDKSCLEAAASGCFVITTDIASSQLSAMSQFWTKYFGLDFLPELADQVRLIQSMQRDLRETARLEIQQNSARMNSASELISKISESLRKG